MMRISLEIGIFINSNNLKWKNITRAEQNAEPYFNQKSYYHRITEWETHNGVEIFTDHLEYFNRNGTSSFMGDKG